MPIAQIMILEGRSEEQRRALLRSVTAAITESLGVKPESVRVIIQQIPPSSWGVGGVPIEERNR
jgi:4-oxalocrotonate tautomerase